MDKAEIRKKMIKLRREEAGAEASAPARLAAQLLGLPEFAAAAEVFLYAAVNGEAGTYEIARLALADGKRVAFPVCKQGSPEMLFYYVESLSELSSGFMKIPEPLSRISPENLAVPTPDANTLMVMPLVAFDKARNRIGYGAGYYDTYLAVHGNNIAAKIALAYDFQEIADGIPAEPHDIKPDIVVTPTRVIK